MKINKQFLIIYVSNMNLDVLTVLQIVNGTEMIFTNMYGKVE